MRLLISYLKEKLPVVGVYAVMLVIFCILFWLKEVPFDVIEYGAELSAIWLLFVGALNFNDNGRKACCSACSPHRTATSRNPHILPIRKKSALYHPCTSCGGLLSAPVPAGKPAR